MNKLPELAVFGRLLHDALGVPVFVIHPGRRIEAEYAGNPLRTNPYFASFVREQVSGYEYALYAADQPVHFTRSRLQYFFVNALDEERLAGTLVLGPIVQERPHDGLWSEELENLHAANRRPLLDLYEKVPLLPPDRARALSLMVHYAIRRQSVDPAASLLADSPLQEPAASKGESDAELSRGRRSGLLHANLAHERVLLHYVRTGERERMRTFAMEFIIGEDEFGVLAKRSRLRSEKNLMITGIALICRAAVEGGLHEEDAFTLSDYYIQQLEEMGSLQEVGAVMTKALFDFVDRVAQVRRGHYSPSVQDCLHEIASQLYGDLSLGRLAERVHLSPNYLSGLFKKEVGLTLSEYIQRERIGEAKKLLALTDYPVADIAAWLSFHDQSYFIKVFKKWEGTTPRAYRRSERRPMRKLH
ncbi:helix-turn-helix domain-containing protein [Paenibacillus sp. P22]|uniref:helix-turn-helix domain-containing protein n=1 Tax=Paenibacillus sp. P22 TaxID=483908 RepID=UPI000422E7E9|nr:helix-turn-helix domain-containing protein [Paenibacillus sp. P22]CDN40986.1 Transcriptional regulator, AraC [Paenibacillus sp. P22]